MSVSNNPNQAASVATRFNYPCKVTVREGKNCIVGQVPKHACSAELDTCQALYCQ